MWLSVGARDLEQNRDGNSIRLTGHRKSEGAEVCKSSLLSVDT